MTQYTICAWLRRNGVLLGACLTLCLLCVTAPTHSGRVPHTAAAAPEEPTLVSPADGAQTQQLSMPLTITVHDEDKDDLTVTVYGRQRLADPSADFTVVALPDTQKYVCGEACNGSPETFDRQIKWIVNNQVAQNIQFVTHVGDIVQHGGDPGNEAEWEITDTILSQLEVPILPHFPDGIPYGLAVGNNDQGNGNGQTGRTELYNRYFGADRFAGRQYAGGHYQNTYENHYKVFNVGSREFIALYIEYDSSPNEDVLDWADGVLKQHPQKWGIVTSHYLLSSSGSYGYQGEKIYEALRDNPNLFLMLAGHVTDEEQREERYHGRTIHTLLANYQGHDNGGDGWLRLLNFSPAAGQIEVRTYSPTRQEFRTNSSSQFTLDIDAQLRPFQSLATFEDVASGSSISTNWENLHYDSQYEWYVAVDDGRETRTSAVFTFTTKACLPTPTFQSTTLPPAAKTATPAPARQNCIWFPWFLG